MRGDTTLPATPCGDLGPSTDGGRGAVPLLPPHRGELILAAAVATAAAVTAAAAAAVAISALVAAPRLRTGRFSVVTLVSWLSFMRACGSLPASLS